MKKNILKNGGWLIAAAWVYTLTFVFNNYWSKFSSVPAIAASFEKRLEKQEKKFNAFCADTHQIKYLQAFQLDTARINPVADKDAYYYLFADTPSGWELQFWSNAVVIPQAADIPYHDTVRLVNYPNGTFLLSARKVPSQQVVAVQLVPIKWQYFLATEYLTVRYPGFEGLEKDIAISNVPTKVAVHLPNGRPLFYLNGKVAKPTPFFNWPSFFIEMIATLFLMVFFQRTAIGLVAVRRFPTALLLLFLGAIGTRLAIGYLHFPVNFSGLPFFEIVNRTWFFNSIGDLLLNLLTVLWIFHFLRSYQNMWLSWLQRFSQNTKSIIAASSMVAMVGITFLSAIVISSLIVHPSVSFNVSNFFSLGWHTLWAIVCVYFMAVIHYTFLHLANTIFVLLWPYHQRFKYLLVAVSGLLILTLSIHAVGTQLLLFVLLWLLLSFLLEDTIPQRLVVKITASANFLLWMIWYALSGMLLILGQNNTKENEQRIRVAEKLGIQADATAEQLLNIALRSNEVRNMAGNFNLFYDSVANHAFRNTLQQRYFSGYLNNYETNYYVFTPNGKPLYNTDATSFEALNNIATTEAQPTKYEGVYYYESAFDKFSYIIKQPLLVLGSATNAYFFVTTTPVGFKKDAMVPELLKQLQENNKDNSANFSYAVYNHLNLVTSNKEYPFVTRLSNSDLPKSQTELRKVGGDDQLWYNAGNGRTVIVVKSGSLLSDAVTLFAYLFGAFILLTFLQNSIKSFVTSNGKFQAKPLRFSGFSINQKIHATIYLICFISFIVIGFVTIKFFIQRFHQNNNNRLTKAINLVNNDLQKRVVLSDYFSSEWRSNKEAIEAAIEPEINRLAALQNVDINLFWINGDLLATSQKIVFERGVIAPKMNEAAYYNLRVKNKVSFLQNEHIGTLQYSSIYLPVRTPTGVTIGFLNIPYFSSQNDLSQEISNFLVTLINFNAFIFLLTGIIAFFITNSITASFAVIAQKMQAVGFGKNNEPISWHRNDEIGVLVLEYNKMIAALDESAKKLARSERESAWREMAKQVAHEIKNPLTPMKLSLQYLQRAIDNNTPNVTALAAQVAHNLVEQINHLSRIASDFSQFAQIDVAKKEIIDLHDIIQQVVLLYEKNRDANIQWLPVGKPLWILADKTQINRLFTNLLQNACEASADSFGIDITIQEQLIQGYVIISLADKGSGIPTALHDYIFTPNFTTKSSGTGLGLAICSDIVEKSDGKIWFNTQLDEGTTFFIQLPLYASAMG